MAYYVLDDTRAKGDTSAKDEPLMNYLVNSNKVHKLNVNRAEREG